MSRRTSAAHAATTTCNLPGTEEKTTKDTGTSSRRALMRQAAQISQEHNLGLSGAGLRVLVDRYLTSGRTNVGFYTWFIRGFDPTCNAAINNVMAERGGRRG